MKHAGQLDQFHVGERPRMASDASGADAASGEPMVKGCAHRDVKLENIIVTADFDTKIMDYGSLKFTDEMIEEVAPDGRTVYNAKTPWQGTDVFKPPYFFYTEDFKVTRVTNVLKTHLS